MSETTPLSGDQARPGQTPPPVGVEQVQPMNTVPIAPQGQASPADIWLKLRQSTGISHEEKLAQLLEAVGPEAYNDFTASDEYLKNRD